MVTVGTTENKKYNEYVKAKLRYDKINRRIAKRKVLKQGAARRAVTGPAWYQDLSHKQMSAAEALGSCLWADIEEGVLVKTMAALVQLGIIPRPSDDTVLHAMKRCYMNPIIFLLQLYKVFGTTPLNKKEEYFCMNDRLILSAMAYLALPRTLAELCLRLPHLSPTPKKYPAVTFRKFPKKKSPYLEMLPFYIHCIRSEEREAAKRRKEYLRKLQVQKEAQELSILPYIHLFELDYSTKPDGQDQIPKDELEKQKEFKQRGKLKGRTKKQAPQPESERQSSVPTKPDPKNLILAAADFRTMHHKHMQLPAPVLTEQTIIAMLLGYWQNIHGPFKPIPPTPEEQKLAQKGGQRAMMCLAKRALIRMARRGNPLASLQDSHSLPQIKQLVRHLCSFKLTQKYKDLLLIRSKQNWNASLGHTPNIPCKPLQFKDRSALTWGCIHSFKKRNNEHREAYLTRVRRAMVDDTREFWASMGSDYLNTPGFRNIFFTYLPSRVQDITFKFKN